MGLSGRKVKQRIPNDPRNLSWADDAARFGSNYLSKFGWDSSKGLGVGGEGRTSHIKVAQKLDMMGIGAAHQKDPNGIAWKQNKDFESLLKRLNEANGMGEGGGEDGSVVDGFVKQKGDVEEKEGDVEEKEGEKEKKKKEKKEKDGGEKKKKRKRDRGGEEAEGKSKKKRKRDNEKVETITPPQSKPAVEEKPAHIVPRHRSHRARHIAAKSLASKSATAISEILGIAPTPLVSSSTTPSGTQTPQEGKLTSIYDDDAGDIEVEKITTSTKSLQDYFKERMGQLKMTDLRTERAEVEYDDMPRGGLGSRPKQAPMSNFSALKSSSFMAAASLSLTFGADKREECLAENGEEKRRRKKEKRERKAEVGG